MSAERTVLFHNKASCSKCGSALALLREHGVEPAQVDITLTPLSADQLRDIASKTGGPVRALLRTGEATYAQLGLDDASLDDDALLAAMAAHPELVERPIVLRGDRAVIGRPAEKLLDLFDRG